MLHGIHTLTLVTLAFICPVAVAQTNLVRNGDFGLVGAKGAPEGWTTSGAPEIKQQLTRDPGPGGEGFSAKLTCAEFHGGTSYNHVMVCQVGVVSVQRGKWYRLSFRAKGQGIRGGIQAGLSNTRSWSSAGLGDGFSVGAAWRPYEFFFRATMDLPAADSRLQICYFSTGTLWLADVALTETEVLRERHPQLPDQGRTNFIPNSSFECGAAGWGSYAPDIGYWYGNAFRLMGEIDPSTAAHGAQSLRMTLGGQSTPTYYFDYYAPVRKQIGSLVAAHEGWLRVTPGQTYTVSASLKADQPGRVGLLFVRQADAGSLRKDVPLSDQWHRYSFSFTPRSEFIWTGVGLDLTASQATTATVWVDAVQLEQAREATAYQPALPVEVMAESTAAGNAFAAETGSAGISLRVTGFNNTATAATSAVSLAVTDYLDSHVLGRNVTLDLPPQGSATSAVTLPVGRLGFFTVAVTAEGQPAGWPLRCMTFGPLTDQDSRFGMNHAYPWDAMLPLAQQAGVLWWRDWTTQWNTVQPARDAPFSFAELDFQIDRVLDQRGKVLALFPFPSADWSSSADAAAMAKLGLSEWERKERVTAFRPTDEPAFARFISESAKHLGGRVQWFQFLNESLYTNYALPAAAGYKLDDYLHLLRLTREALNVAQPQAKLLGGLGIWADSKYTRDFVEAGGLQLVDALDLHLYPHADPQAYGDSLARLWERMRERGEPRPIWITELGCYADDDPAITPYRASFNDAAVRNAVKSSEREATEWLIQFATLVFANGGEKLFLHGGFCGEINGDLSGSVLFRYAGAPRKVLPAISAMANLLPPAARFDRRESAGDQTSVYWFTVEGGRVGVAWSEDGEPHRLRLPDGARVLDLMGNPCAAPEQVDGTPIYLLQ